MDRKSSTGRLVEELRLLEAESRFESKRQRMRVVNIVIAVYVIAVVVFALSFVFKLPLFGAVDDKNDTSNAQQYDQLDAKIKSLEKALAEKSESDNAALAARVGALENTSKALSDTILTDADKALTARLLREKQTNLEKSFEDIKKSNEQTQQLVVTFIFTIVGAPLAGVLIAWAIEFFKERRKGSDDKLLTEG